MYSPTMSINLFDNAYIPNWQSLLRSLGEMALPESWTFKTAPIDKLRRDNLVLERYINAILRVQVANMQHEANRDEADQYFLIRSGYACFHTGLLTSRYKPIYCYLEKNQDGYNKNWKLQGFYDDTHPRMQHVEKLPSKPFFYLKPEEWGVFPQYPHSRQRKSYPGQTGKHDADSRIHPWFS